MSRYIPRISIRIDLADPSAVTGAFTGDVVYDAIADKITHYSITPRTLSSVTEFHQVMLLRTLLRQELEEA